MTSIKEIINKILGLPTAEDIQKAKEQKVLLDKVQDTIDDIFYERTMVDRHLDDLQNSIDLMGMYANSTIIRTIGKYKDENIFAVSIIKQVGQNYQRIGLSIIIDCEQKCIVDEKGKIIMEWSEEDINVTNS